MSNATFKCLILACSWFLLSEAFANALVGEPAMQTFYSKETKSFVTEGTLQVAASREALDESVFNLSDYRLWALQRINDKPGGGSFIVQVRELDWRPKLGSVQLGVLKIIFDIDLPWPFRLMGEAIHLKRTEPLDALQLKLEEKTATIRSFQALLRTQALLPDPGSPLAAPSSLLQFRIDVTLLPVLNLFFSESLYRNNVGSRIERIMKNLARRVAEQGVSSPKPADSNSGLNSEQSDSH